MASISDRMEYMSTQAKRYFPFSFLSARGTADSGYIRNSAYHIARVLWRGLSTKISVQPEYYGGVD
jgi:hypothetical protein